MKKKLTITGIFNDFFTNYEDKESSITVIIDDELDCKCTPFKKCFIHKNTKGYVLSDISDTEKERPVSKVHTILEIAKAVEEIERKEPMQKLAANYVKSKSSSSVFQKAHYDDFIAGFTTAEQTTFSNKEALELLIKMNNWSTSNTGQEEVTNWFQHHKKK